MISVIELAQRPAVETVRRDFLRIGLRVEVVQVAQQVPQRVADLAVLVAELLDRLRAGGDVVLVVDAAASTGAAGPRRGVSISCVAVTYSLSLLLTFVPSGLTTKPCVSTCLNGGLPVAPRLGSSESWNQPRCWSEPSRYRSAGNFRYERHCSTASPRAAGFEPDVEDVLLLAELVRVGNPGG